MDDKQAPRLSYVANEIIMPRKKYSDAHDLVSPPGTGNLRLVGSDEVDSADNTILLGEFSDSANCIWAARSEEARPTRATVRPTGQEQPGKRRLRREGYVRGTQVYKLTYAEAMNAIDAVLADMSAAPTSHHISYINPNATGRAATTCLQTVMPPSSR